MPQHGIEPLSHDTSEFDLHFVALRILNSNGNSVARTNADGEVQFVVSITFIKYIPTGCGNSMFLPSTT